MTRATLFADVPEVVCAALRLRLPDVRDIAPHPGRFDLAEMERTVTRGVAVRVSLLGLRANADLGGPEFPIELRLAAFALATQGDAAARAALCATVAQVIVTSVQAFRFADPDLGPARVTEAVNLYGGSARSGAALWGVSWTQPAQLSRRASVEPVYLRRIFGAFAPDFAPELAAEVPE